MKPSLASTILEDMQTLPARESAEHRIDATPAGAGAENSTPHSAAPLVAEQVLRAEGTQLTRVGEESGALAAAQPVAEQTQRVAATPLMRVAEPGSLAAAQAVAEQNYRVAATPLTRVAAPGAGADAQRVARVSSDSLARDIARPTERAGQAPPRQSTPTPPKRSARRVSWRKLSGFAVGFASLALWLTLWELASRYEWEFLFRFENIPAPSEVFVAVGELLGTPKFGAHVVNSIRRVFIGFSIASLLAVSAGLVIGRFRLASQALLPPLEVLRPIPAVAWIPIAILLFASAEHSIVFITFIGAFFPALLNTIHGVETLDRRLVSASISLGAGPFAVFSEVILPGALPSIVTGLSIGMGTSWFSLVTSEMISGQFGIGYYTWEAYTLQQYPHIVLGMISIGVLGMGSSFLVKWSGRRFMPWFEPNTSTR